MSSIIPVGIPFAQIPYDAIEDTTITPVAFRVLAYLFRRANSESRAWPSQRTIAKDIGINKSTVVTAIEQLTDAGWIAVHTEQDQAVTGHRQRHSYVVFGTRPATLFDRTDTPTGRGERTGTVRMKHPDRTDEPDITTTRELQPENYNQKERKPDLLWEAFVAVHGEPATESERGKYNRTVKSLRDAAVTPDEYPALVAAFTTKHNGLQPAVVTVSERVGELRHFITRGPVTVRSIDEVEADRRWAALESRAIGGGGE